MCKYPHSTIGETKTGIYFYYWRNGYFAVTLSTVYHSCKQRSRDAIPVSFSQKKMPIYCFPTGSEQELGPKGENILFGPFVRSLSIIIKHDRCMLLRRYSIESSLAQLRSYPHHLRLDRDLWQLYDHQSWHGCRGPPLLGIEWGREVEASPLSIGSLPPQLRCASVSPRQEAFPKWSPWLLRPQYFPQVPQQRRLFGAVFGTSLSEEVLHLTSQHMLQVDQIWMLCQCHGLINADADLYITILCMIDIVNDWRNTGNFWYEADHMRLILHSQKQLAHWAVDVTVKFYAYLFSSSLTHWVTALVPSLWSLCL